MSVYRGGEPPTNLPDGWVEVEGDKPKVERTRQYFSALRAGLKTAEEVSYELQRENERLREALREACTAYAECANPSLHPDDKEAAWHDLGDVLKAAAWCEGMAK